MSFSKKEVDLIFQKIGKRIKTAWLDFIVAPKSQDLARILVITSRKIGNAPKRNKLRRRLKSIFYESQYYNLNQDIIVIAKPGSVSLTFEQLREMLAKVVSINEAN